MTLNTLKHVESTDDPYNTYVEDITLGKGTTLLEASLILYFIDTICNMGEIDFFASVKSMDNIDNYNIHTKLEYYRVTALCPKCSHHIYMHEQFAEHILELTKQYMDQTSFNKKDDSYIYPDLHDIALLLWEGKMGMDFEYKCTNCECQLSYKTFTLKSKREGAILPTGIFCSIRFLPSETDTFLEQTKHVFLLLNNQYCNVKN